jgi:hypothetical protein
MLLLLFFAYDQTMAIAEPLNPDIPSGIGLRTELSLRSLRFAALNGLLHECTDGQTPSIIFGPSADGRHGNFHPRAYSRICSNRDWSKRLAKVHTAFKRSRVRANWQWKELDCATSSDALLMNIFCHPEVLKSVQVRAMLGVGSAAEPQFGFKPRIPLQSGRGDNTEVDMKLDNLLVEAKLTEADFQSSRFDLISRYRDLEMVFEVAQLPVRDRSQTGYQLIRGALAAYAAECSFCVFCDARRPDLAEAWYRIMRAVHRADLRCRLKLLTWQELSFALPGDLQHFLSEKYGIF